MDDELVESKKGETKIICYIPYLLSGIILSVIFLFLSFLVYALQPDAPAESTEGAATAINYLVSLL